MTKLIKKSYPRKGVKLELYQHYNKHLYPKRRWKLWVKFKNNRYLEIHGILTDKKEAIEFYKLVYKSFGGKKE